MHFCSFHGSFTTKEARALTGSEEDNANTRRKCYLAHRCRTSLMSWQDFRIYIASLAVYLYLADTCPQKSLSENQEHELINPPKAIFNQYISEIMFISQ